MNRHRPRPIGSGGFIPPVQRGKQLRQVPRRSVPCPDCGAEAGQPCMASTGNIIPASHQSRTRMATRKFNEQRRSTAG